MKQKFKEASDWAKFITREWCKRNQIELPSDKSTDLIRLIRAGIMHNHLGNHPDSLDHPDTKKLLKFLSDNR